MVKSWLVIGAVTIAVAIAGSAFMRPEDLKWFRRLQRPRWLTFEPLIPIIWTIIFICGAWSAYLVWEANPGAPSTWWLMAGYVIVEAAIVAYSPVLMRLRSLKAGTIVGAVGFILGAILTALVLPISKVAALLLVPYLVWSPIGTYTTWAMHRLNSK
jgi:tryptophan-rich sensory protein